MAFACPVVLPASPHCHSCKLSRCALMTRQHKNNIDRQQTGQAVLVLTWPFTKFLLVWWQDVFPSMMGRTYGEARRCFDNAVLCGVLNAQSDVTELNPADSCVLGSSHKLVFLSETAHIKPSRQASCPQYRLRGYDCLPDIVQGQLR